MTSLSPTALALVFALAFVPVAEAGTVVFFDTYGSLQANGQFFESTNPSGGFATGGAYNVSWSVGQARVDPAAHPYNFSRASSSLFSGSSATEDAASEFRTSFSIDVPFLIDFRFSVDADGTAFAGGSFFNETAQTMLAEATVRDGFRPLRFEGVLDPGVYSVSLFAEVLNPQPGFQTSRGLFVGDMELREVTAVPEPATMTLFGVGLAAAAWRRRKK